MVSVGLSLVVKPSSHLHIILALQQGDIIKENVRCLMLGQILYVHVLSYFMYTRSEGSDETGWMPRLI